MSHKRKASSPQLLLSFSRISSARLAHFDQYSPLFSHLDLSIMPTRYEDYDRPASRAAYENAIANTSILHIPNPIYTATEADDTQSTITAFEEVYHVKEGKVPQVLPRVDNIPDSPIHYEDDGTPEDLDAPDLPFFLNHPTSHRFFPLEIPQPDGSKVLTKYIHYTNQGMTVVGCMSRSEPRYGCPVYLTTPHATQIPEAPLPSFLAPTGR